MKLDPETLEVVAFPTTAEPDTTSYVLQQAAVSEFDACHVWFSDCASC